MAPGDGFRPARGRHPARSVRHVAVVLCACASATAASNTAPTRSFTTEWLCDNGRVVLVNAHPRRPGKEAWVTYGGQRVAVVLAPAASGARYASADGRVVWYAKGDEAALEFKGVLEQAIACRPKPPG